MSTAAKRKWSQPKTQATVPGTCVSCQHPITPGQWIMRHHSKPGWRHMRDCPKRIKGDLIMPNGKPVRRRKPQVPERPAVDSQVIGGRSAAKPYRTDRGEPGRRDPNLLPRTSPGPTGARQAIINACSDCGHRPAEHGNGSSYPTVRSTCRECVCTGYRPGTTRAPRGIRG